LRRTLLRRPDLLDPTQLLATDFPLLRELMAEELAIHELSPVWLPFEPPPKVKRNRTRRQKIE
jgi:hypothetical protein